jgi:hypothetical protein
MSESGFSPLNFLIDTKKVSLLVDDEPGATSAPYGPFWFVRNRVKLIFRFICSLVASLERGWTALIIYQEQQTKITATTDRNT